MKPWEETWKWIPFAVGGDYVAGTDEDREVFSGVVTTDSPPDLVVSSVIHDANGPLIAAAPEMARMLLELYKEHGDRHTFDWAYWFTEIEAVLEKAGVPVPRHSEEER